MDGYIIRARNINQAQTDTAMDAGLLETIYNQYYKNIYNYIRFRVNDRFDAEELTSSVFENAMRKFRTYKPEQSPVEAWLIGIAKNIVTDYLRRKKRKNFVPLDSLDLNPPSDGQPSGQQPEETAVLNEEACELLRAMERLKDKERQILAMKFATDLKNREIAELFGISESNVGVIVHRSIRKLRKILSKESGIDGR